MVTNVIFSTKEILKKKTITEIFSTKTQENLNHLTKLIVQSNEEENIVKKTSSSVHNFYKFSQLHYF